MNVESQAIATQNTTSQTGKATSVLLPAMLRLSLLVVPETLTIWALAHNPIICAVVCIAVLAAWLYVDVGPFRAETAPSKAPESRPVALPSFRNIVRPQWWNGLFCRIVICVIIFHSKLHI